jgi:hypothetical protein
MRKVVFVSLPASTRRTVTIETSAWRATSAFVGGRVVEVMGKCPEGFLINTLLAC